MAGVNDQPAHVSAAGPRRRPRSANAGHVNVIPGACFSHAAGRVARLRRSSPHARAQWPAHASHSSKTARNRCSPPHPPKHTSRSRPTPCVPQARELATLLRAHRLASHVNVIPWNPVDESEYQRPSNTAVSAFRGVLEGAGIPTSLRVTRGLEAAAACGQLRNSFQKAAVPEPRQLR